MIFEGYEFEQISGAGISNERCAAIKRRAPNDVNGWRTGAVRGLVFQPNFDCGRQSSVRWKDDRAVHDDVGLRYRHQTRARGREDFLFRLQGMRRGGSGFLRNHTRLPEGRITFVGVFRACRDWGRRGHVALLVVGNDVDVAHGARIGACRIGQDRCRFRRRIDP
jgi:hypothetical protein